MIVKEKLAALSMCYSITVMEYSGRKYCVSASEERDGEIVMIDTETKEVSRITGLDGGVMAIIPIPEENGAFLAIQRFYPVFDSRGAQVVCCRLPEAAAPEMKAEVKLVADIPFVHRIALTGKPGSRKMIAATLCRDKEFVDDWSQPGSVYEYTLDGEMQVTGKRTLIEGIFKNHGMYTYEKQGGSYILVSGNEGVWAIDGNGGVQKLSGEPVSDLCMYDVDRDGMDEMVCIAPFHGDHMNVFKKEKTGWSCTADEPIRFGHAIWSGMCGGAPVILSCSRDGDKCTRLYRPEWEGEELRMETLDVDEGVGASNIYVEEKDGVVVLYAANHGIGEVARYTIEL